MTDRPERDRDIAGTQAAMLRATRRALNEAKMRGELVPQWREGKVVWVRPEEIELPPDPNEKPTSPDR